MYIDCDTHIDECADTWAYMPEEVSSLRPVSITFDPEHTPGYLRPGYERCWFIDGQIHYRQIRSDERTGTTEGMRELYDVAARVRDMDKLGVGVQVLYPTALLNELSPHPRLMTALCRSYNRWIADRCSQSGGRLRWVAMMPLVDIDAALIELRWAKEHGAVGAYKRGVEVGGRPAGDPYFHPFYNLARDLDLPVCIHAGQPWRPVNSHYTVLWPSTNDQLQLAFNSLISANIPTKFQGLRVGFIESGAGWVPYALWQQRANKSLVPHANRNALTSEQIQLASQVEVGILGELNFWVTCETSEDVPYLISTLGEDNLIIGSDYGHPDRASIKDAQLRMYEISGVTQQNADKATTTNGANFYGLDVVSEARLSA